MIEQRAVITLRTWLAFAVFVGLFVLAPEALGQDDTQTRYVGILEAFRDQSVRWQGVLTSAARWLFFTLAIAQFAWINMELALKGGDLSDFISENTRTILGTGIMYVFLVHSYEWSTSLVMGFRQAGERAVIASAGAGAESSIDPAGVFQNGLIVAGSLFSQMGIWSGADNVSLVICALVLLVCFAFLSAFMALAIVESYIVIGGSVLMLGFGGSRWTSDIAKRALMYAVAVGAKLFTLQLIVGVAMGSVIEWAQTYESDDSTSTLSLVGLVLLVTICAKQIPEIVQGVLSGASPGGTGAMMATIAAGVAAASAGAASVRAGGGGGAGGGASGAAASAGGAPGGGGGPGAAGPGAPGSGAAGAAAHSGAGDTRGASRAFSEGGGNLAKMAGHIVETGSGLSMGAAIGPLQSAARGGGGGSAVPSGASMDVGAKPTPPQGAGSSSGSGSPASSTSGSGSGASSGAGPSSSAGGSMDGGTIRPASGSSSSSASSAEQSSASPSMSAGAAAPSPGAALQSAESGDPRSLDDRSQADGPQLAASQLSPSQASAVSALDSSFGGDPQPLDQRGDDDQSTSSSTRLRHATRAAVAGFVVAGPAGAAIGAAAGAAAAPQLEAVGKRAAERWAAAKARFGLST